VKIISEEYDPELEELLRKKAERQRQVSQRAEEEKRREAEARKEAILRQILTPEARERINNIKLVRPEFASALEDQLIVLAQQGRINIPLTDEELKEILQKLSDTTTRREYNFKIRERGWTRSG